MTIEFADLGLALFVEDQLTHGRSWSCVDCDGVSYLACIEVALDVDGEISASRGGAMAAYYPWSPASIRAAHLICASRFAARFGDTK